VCSVKHRNQFLGGESSRPGEQFGDCRAAPVALNGRDSRPVSRGPDALQGAFTRASRKASLATTSSWAAAMKDLGFSVEGVTLAGLVPGLPLIATAIAHDRDVAPQEIYHVLSLTEPTYTPAPFGRFSATGAFSLAARLMIFCLARMGLRPWCFRLCPGWWLAGLILLL